MTNSAMLMVSKVLSWAFAFVMVVLLPRYLGDAAYGKLYFAISFTTMLTIIVEFGLNSLVTREVVRRPELARAYLLDGAALKGLMWLVAVAVIAGVLHVARYPADTRLAVYVLTAAIITGSLSQLAVAVLQALGKMLWIGVSQVAEKAIVAAVGVAVLIAGRGFIAVAVVMLLASALTLALNAHWLSRCLPHPGGTGAAGRITVRRLFREALPFFSVLFFGAIYFRIDVLIMSLFASDKAVGWYGAAYRLFETLNFFPEVLMFALFPVLCRVSVSDAGQLKVAAEKGLTLLLTVAMPVAVGVFLLSDRIVAFLYGGKGFENSADVLRVLALVVVFLYTNAILVRLLIATDRQHKLALTAAAAAVVNVGLNLLLIPRFQHMGAAVVTLVTEVLVLALNFSFLPRWLFAGLDPRPLLRTAGAVAIMAVALLALRTQHFLLAFAAGVVVYGCGLLVLKAVPREDLVLVRRALFRLQPKAAE